MNFQEFRRKKESGQERKEKKVHNDHYEKPLERHIKLSQGRDATFCVSEIRQTEKKKIVSRKVRKAAKFRKKNKEIHTSEQENCIDVQDGEDRRPETEKLPDKGPGKQIIEPRNTRNTRKEYMTEKIYISEKEIMHRCAGWKKMKIQRQNQTKTSRIVSRKARKAAKKIEKLLKKSEKDRNKKGSCRAAKKTEKIPCKRPAY